MKGAERQGNRKTTGYYEIGMTARYLPQMKASVLAGNVIFNRLHWHEHLEVMCCLKGEFHMRVDGEEFLLREGDFLTVNPNAMHEIFDGTRDGLQIIFSVDASLLKKRENEIYAFSTVGEDAVAKSHRDTEAFFRILGELAAMLVVDGEGLLRYVRNSGGRYEELIFGSEEAWYRFQAGVYQCLACLARHKKKGDSGKKQRAPEETLRACIEKIHREYGELLDAATLAKAAGVSEPTVYRMFQRYLGISVNDYIRLVRVGAACAMLERGEGNVAEIAYACGFTSLSNFYRIFRQQTGQTPKDYKRSQRTIGMSEKRFQKDFLELNDFQNFFELPYDRVDLIRLTGGETGPDSIHWRESRA